MFSISYWEVPSFLTSFFILPFIINNLLGGYLALYFQQFTERDLHGRNCSELIDSIGGGSSEVFRGGGGVEQGLHRTSSLYLSARFVKRRIVPHQPSVTPWFETIKTTVNWVACRPQ